MRSLNTHLRESEGHDHLPFHPDCPICRQTRLAGELAAAAVVPFRAQAALAASLLALSTAGPAASAFAAEQDSEQDGSTPVAQSGSDPTDNPDFDPGGASTDLPETAPPAPQAQAPSDPGNADSGPVDQSPTTDPSEPVVDSGDGSDTPTAPASPPETDQPSTPTSSGSSQPAAPTSPAATEPAPAPPDSAAPTSTAVEQVRAAPAERKVKPPRHSHRVHVPAHPRQAATTSNEVAPRAPITVTTPAPPPTPAPLPIVHHAKPGDHSYTVQAGESLWAIATDMLASDATPARVAREVHRLWQLNRGRIGTGDPDLLMVGTRLVLQ